MDNPRTFKELCCDQELKINFIGDTHGEMIRRIITDDHYLWSYFRKNTDDRNKAVGEIAYNILMFKLVKQLKGRWFPRTAARDYLARVRKAESNIRQKLKKRRQEFNNTGKDSANMAEPTLLELEDRNKSAWLTCGTGESSVIGHNLASRGTSEKKIKKRTTRDSTLKDVSKAVSLFPQFSLNKRRQEFNITGNDSANMTDPILFELEDRNTSTRDSSLKEVDKARLEMIELIKEGYQAETELRQEKLRLEIELLRKQLKLKNHQHQPLIEDDDTLPTNSFNLMSCVQ